MVCARLRINILQIWNRWVTPLPSLGGMARCSLQLCSVHPKQCGYYYAMSAVIPAMLECISVNVHSSYERVLEYVLKKEKGGSKEKTERIFVCGSFMEQRVLM